MAEINNARWRALCKRLKWTLPPVCWLDGEPIDLSLSGRHPRGWSLDHVIPRAEAPHLMYELSNLRPAHMICNSTRGGRGPSNVKYSRKWG